MISKEKFLRKVNKLRNEKNTMKDKWRLVKEETGQTNFSSPKLIHEGNKNYTSHKEMAASLNRQYIAGIRRLVQQMESEDDINDDPIGDYRKGVGKNYLSFTFKQVSMKQLRDVLQRMKPTGSMGMDDLSMKVIKQAQSELEPLILHLVNSVIKTNKYPKGLKTTKIISIEKKGKDKNSVEGWRPVNVIAALSKIIERVLLQQILEHLESNNLINAAHHGAVKGKSTQSLVNEVHYWLVETMTAEKEAAVIVLYQSKAYDLVSHKILLMKLEVLGFKPQAVRILKSFLEDRKQSVQIEGQRSDQLIIGPYSVIQGSTMSCALYLIYIMDMPNMFHSSNHNPIEQRNCKRPNLKTFVDDSYVLVLKEDNKDIKTTILETMEIINKYTRGNKLKLNPDQSQIMLQTKDVKMREEFSIELGGKVIQHQKEITILGNTLSQELTWNNHVNKILLPSLRNRTKTLKAVTKYLDKKFRVIFANFVFKSRMMFGLETWGGSLKLLGTKFKPFKIK